MIKPDLSGMTGNERLYALGLMERRDEAAFARDRETMLAIMRECEVSPSEQPVGSTDRAG